VSPFRKRNCAGENLGRLSLKSRKENGPSILTGRLKKTLAKGGGERNLAGRGQEGWSRNERCRTVEQKKNKRRRAKKKKGSVRKRPTAETEKVLRAKGREKRGRLRKECHLS